MKLTLRDNLPFVSVKVTYQSQEIEISNVLLDTGSATTLLAADSLAHLGIVPEPDDILYTIRGVGGTEVVFSREVDAVQVDQKRLARFQLEIGGMDYGFEINGILGMDFLVLAGAIVNLNELRLEFVDT